MNSRRIFRCVAFCALSGSALAVPNAPNPTATATPQAVPHLTLSARDREVVEVGRKDLGRALSLIESQYADREQASAKGMLLTELGKLDLRYIAEIPKLLAVPARQSLVLSPILSTWTMKDAGAIFHYAEGLPESAFNRELQSNLAIRLARNGNFDMAKSLVEKMPASPHRTATVRNVVGNYHPGTRDATIEWVLTFQEPERNEALLSLGSRFNEVGDISGLCLVAPHLPAESQEKLLLELGEKTAENGWTALEKTAANPRLIPQWSHLVVVGGLLSLPAGDLPPAMEVALKFEEQSLRERATSYFVHRRFVDDRHATIQWVMSAPADLRTLAFEAIIRDWYRVDGEGVDAWVGTLEDPDHDMALKILRRTQQRFGPSMPAPARK